MGKYSQLQLSKVPRAFVEIAEKHNSVVELLRTMTGTGGCNVLFSEGKIIISVSASTTGGGSVTVPDPLTLNTFNGTNFNGGTFTGSFSGNLTGNVTGNVSGNAGTVTNGVYTTDTGTVTNTMLAGSIANNKLTNSKVTIGSTNISLGDTATSIAGLSSLSATSLSGTLTGNVTGNLTGNVTGDVSGNLTGNVSGNLNGTSVTASSVSTGFLAATSITATAITASYRIDTNRMVANVVTANTFGSETSNASTFVTAEQILMYNNFTGAGFILSSLSLNHTMTLREIDVCDSGTPKKMLMMASAPY